ncbi:MAG: GNAT family N-acetyltransferase [Muribaculaceae bacterium]|nr:GNAT family N-acetyltransferase [Muribaculaceae bacterium]
MNNTHINNRATVTTLNDAVSTTEVKETVMEMWRESFKVDEQWLKMYFDRVYRDDDVLTMTAGDDDDVIASSLLLQRYTLYFHSMPVPMGYVSGATTRREYRDRGYMRELMNRALEFAYDRGDAVVALIPENRRLFFYYDRLGFSTVFYVDEERYTDVHRFEYTGRYTAVNPADSHEVFSAFDRMMRRRDNVVVHTYADLQNILLDVTMDGGHTIVLRNDNNGEIEAIAMVVPKDERIVVRELLADNVDARDAALEHARQLFPGKPVTVVAPPDEHNIPIHSRGMARLVNARKLLAAYAARYPKLSMSIKLYDPILPNNSHIYIIDGGEVVLNDGFGGKIDLDVSPETLLSILCSDAPIGDIFGMPTARPYISLMLD